MTDGRTYRYVAQTHVGLKRRVNEDAILALPDHNIWMVSDGMGGHQAGDFASALIVDAVATLPIGLDPTAKMHGLREKLQEAHRAIQAESQARGGSTIGATVVALILANGHFLGLWAGDSRLYRLRNGVIELLTSDHSAVADYVLAGKMDWDEAEQHPHSNAITRAVGVGGELELDKIRGAVEPGDRFLVCSDGLTKYATFPKLQQVLSSAPLETVGDQLLQIALDGGGADNISHIIVDVV